MRDRPSSRAKLTLNMMRSADERAQDDARILTKAINRIAGLWNLTDIKLGEMLAMCAVMVAAFRSDKAHLEPDSPPLLAARYLVRLFAGLDTALGSDNTAVLRWLHATNEDLGARPIDILDSPSGLEALCDYVDGSRERS